MTLRVVIFFFLINLQHQWLHMHIYFMFVKEAKNCVEVYGLGDQRKQVLVGRARPTTQLGNLTPLPLWAKGFNRSEPRGLIDLSLITL